MAKDFLLEIGLEEMPAKYAPGVIDQLENNAAKMLKDLRLEYQSLKAYVTPRRIALYIKELAESQQDIKEEVKGPAQKAAYDAEGKPTKAALGFAKGQGVAVEDLFIQEFNGIPYVYAQKFLKGELAEKLLPDFCQAMLTSLNFPKPMRWGEHEIRFIRPIRWLVALYGDQVVPFAYAGLNSGRTSRGHRTLGGYVRLVRPEEYFAALEAAYVLVDQERRKAEIWNQIRKLAVQAGGLVEEDEDLLTEITHLVEYPTALLGDLDIKYLALPEEVITTPMKEHQKYFPVRGQDGKLLPYFITVRNGDSTALEVVREGNKKVLKARLEDAAFYFREDLKKPLAEFVSELDKVVYHDKLGTVGQRVERLRQLAGYIADRMGLDQKTMELVDRTAYLAKADLVTHMVYDFPELQGIMGGYYAKYSGEDAAVCTGIVEHYRPRFSGDEFPATTVGETVSLADKIDAIVGSFGIGIQPSGSQDPYALRRQALGVVGILLKDSRNLALTDLIEKSYEIFAEQGIALEPLAEILPALEDFFNQRVRYLLLESGLRYDTVDAVLALGEPKPYQIGQKAQVLADLRTKDEFEAYINAYTRCVNLSKKTENAKWNAEDLVDDSEKVLANALAEKSQEVTEACQRLAFSEAYAIASELIPLIERLFDSVMIMVEDEKLRIARLGLLRDCVKTLGFLGDLTLLA
ncbi:MAG: glycine--tRNA ligase subunit beta [Peptococcaceae bacterium]|nr:glycine--tRNA ligase subunit beta [Peptococcaceae bacterium]